MSCGGTCVDAIGKQIRYGVCRNTVSACNKTFENTVSFLGSCVLFVVV